MFVGIMKGNVMKHAFTDLFVKNIKKAGRYTDPDTKGLNLQVKSNLQKYWTFRYVFESKRYDLALGAYPEVLVKEARKRAISARNDLNQGTNPKPQKKFASDVIEEPEAKLTFKEYALSCIDMKRPEWTNQKHADQWVYTMEKFAFPIIGDKAIDEVDTEDILKILMPIWTTKTETASRLRGRLEWILASATTRKHRKGMNPAIWRGNLQTILAAPNKVRVVEHHKALSYKALPNFITKLHEGEGIAFLALEFAILNASRTGEVIGGLRSEVDGDVWIIPAKRMKAKKEHRVPLCKRSMEILTIAISLDPDSEYLFSKKGKPLSNMAMPMAVRRLGFDVTVHGFRSTFRDWVSEETNHSPEVAEMALAHAITNKVEAAYRRKDLLDRRRSLMNDWEGFCTTPRENNVLQLKIA
jgi:integrase